MRRAGQALGPERLRSPGLPHGPGAAWWGGQPGPGGGLPDFKLTCLSHTSIFNQPPPSTLHLIASAALSLQNQPSVPGKTSCTARQAALGHSPFLPS